MLRRGQCISQVNLLITNSAFRIVQRATAQSKIGIDHNRDVVEAPPGFQAGWFHCMCILFFFCSFWLLIWSYRVCLCSYGDTVRVGAQPRCLVETRSVSLLSRSALQNRKIYNLIWLC
jgi:hypothetical protein